jgi:hypothetical protein
VYDYAKSNQKYITITLPFILIGDYIIYENGVTIGVNGGGLSFAKFYFRNKPYLSTQKTIARESHSVEDVVENIKKYHSIKPLLYIVSNGEPEHTFVVDQTDIPVVRKLKDNLVRTNNFFDKENTKIRYKNNFKQNRWYKNSYKRYRRIKKHIKDVDSWKEAVKILRIHTEDFSSDKGSVANKGTCQGAVVDPINRKLYLPVGRKVPVTYYGKWKEFDIDKIFSKPNT